MRIRYASLPIFLGLPALTRRFTALEFQRVLFHVRQALLPYVAQLSIATLLGRLLHTFMNIGQAKVFPEKLGEADQDAGAHQVQTVIVLLVQANALNTAVHIPRIIQGFHQATQRRCRDTGILGNATLSVKHIAAIGRVDVAQHAGGQVQTHQQLLGHALDGQKLLPPGTPVAMNAIQAAQVRERSESERGSVAGAAEPLSGAALDLPSSARRKVRSKACR
ncbi:hypothetical protein PL963_P400016 (plasmid) [Pseudomonas cerasi]|uniref:Uncharacterized protein n=1 Tax=Pseudomonas cerasi TaxID=1583341 RepID=A0A2K4W3D3_9PSED|nr:hypothetical protein PL963_P400016 [Pseudomonas cerasi]